MLHLAIVATFLCVLSVQSTTPCYNEKNEPIFCNPEFANIVQNYRSSLFANSTCGSALKEEKVCPVFFSVNTVGALDSPTPPYNKAECELCDSRSVVDDRQHPVEHITKSTYFGSGNQLCWMSQPGESKPVMVEIDFGKLMDALYIVLRFCNEPATDITILKTSDFGATWYPIHFINENCLSAKGIDPDADVIRNEPSCGPLQKQQSQLLGLYSAAHNQRNYDDSELQSRKLATGFRVLFNGYAPETSIDQAYQFYSLASMEVGGQCQCNGHANLCDSDGTKTRCECQHNTYGNDCESCHPFYQDLPWRAATPNEGFECKKCSCSGHSDECYFDQDVFDRSGGVSGGVCLNCKHNTKGRFCHQCAEGFYRTPNTPIDSPDACSPCDCHPAGSSYIDRCDPITGNCMCKQNVRGRNCATCEDGYRISDDNDMPCVKNTYRPKPEQEIHPPFSPPIWKPAEPAEAGMLADSPQECLSEKNKVLKYDAFCKYDVVIKVSVGDIAEKTSNGGSYMFELNVLDHMYSTFGGQRLPPTILVSVPTELVSSCISFHDKNHNYYVFAGDWLKLMSKESMVYPLTGSDIVLKSKGSLDNKVKRFRTRKLKGKKCK